MKLVIHISKDSLGKFFASRSFEGMGDDLLPGNIFTLKQNDRESIPDFEKRCRQEARKRNILHVNNLD